MAIKTRYQNLNVWLAYLYTRWTNYACKNMADFLAIPTSADNSDGRIWATQAREEN